MSGYWIALAVLENTVLAFEPMSLTVPTTNTRITASITAYSAISCPSSSHHNLLIWRIIDCGSLLPLENDESIHAFRPVGETSNVAALGHVASGKDGLDVSHCEKSI
jgi:hypothetical protein